MLRAHPTIPPREIEAVVPTGFGVVNVVMGGGGEPIEEGSAVGVRRHEFVAAVSDGVAHKLVQNEKADD